MTTDTVGGVWTYALDLARTLAPRGIRTVLATMGAPLSADQRQEADSVTGLEVAESAYRLEWMENPWEDVRAAGDWLLALEERVRPYAVHLNGYAHGDLPWRAPTLVVGHSCVLSWWRAVKGEDAPDGWSRYREAVARGLAAADAVAAPTAAMLRELERHYGPLAGARVVVNGRDPARFSPAPKEPLIFSAGRLWDDAKNLSALDRVAGGLDWPVLVAGDAAHPDGGEARPEHVRMLGRLRPDALAATMARAAVYALPARYEPFGLSALEAGLCGCALVLGDIPSLREVWGDAAVFVAPDDPDRLREELRRLIADAEHRGRMAARARARALTYTPERMADSYARIYGDLAGNRRKEAAPCAS